jgi:hypothetical protein
MFNMRKRNTRKKDREILQGIIGILKVKNKDNFDYKKEYRKLLEKKYGEKQSSK